jgi:hypothetical protein
MIYSIRKILLTLWLQYIPYSTKLLYRTANVYKLTKVIFCTFFLVLFCMYCTVCNILSIFIILLLNLKSYILERKYCMSSLLLCCLTLFFILWLHTHAHKCFDKQCKILISTNYAIREIFWFHNYKAFC